MIEIYKYNPRSIWFKDVVNDSSLKGKNETLPQQMQSKRMVCKFQLLNTSKIGTEMAGVKIIAMLIIVRRKIPLKDL